MAANFIQFTERLQWTHKQRVLRLYRHSLKHLLSWTVDRRVFREQAFLMRAEFDESKHLTDRTQIERVVSDGEARFLANRHPQPYISPEAPGGSKWERNIPPDPQMCKLLPEEEKWLKEMTEWADEKH